MKRTISEKKGNRLKETEILNSNECYAKFSIEALNNNRVALAIQCVSSRIAVAGVIKYLSNERIRNQQT